MEEFVKPFDISTNLFFYEAPGADIEDSEYVIINARKQYSDIDIKSDPKPIDCAFNLDMGQFYNKEFILTALIPIKSGESPFREIYPYVNQKSFEYTYTTEDASDSELDELENAHYKRVRYVDYMRPNAEQRLLYKLATNQIDFSTVDDFEVEALPSSSISVNLENNTNLNKFTLPCKLKFRFDNLVFEQLVKEGDSNNNISNITYDNRFFDSEFINRIKTDIARNAADYEVENQRTDSWYIKLVIISMKILFRIMN